MGIAQELSGTGVALVTPFDENLEIDTVAYRRLVKHCISGGVDYLVVNGTTAESATTSTEEKQGLLEITREEAIASNKAIMFGLGGNNTQELVSKLRTLDTKGINSILSVCPYYSKPSQEGIYQHYKTLAENSPLPIVLYNVPGRTGVSIHASTVARLAQIPSIVGIKEASGDINLAIDIKRLTPSDFLLISGDDMVTVPMIAIGGIGSISVLANAFLDLYTNMTRFALNGDYKDASALLFKLAALNPLMYEEGNPVGIKSALEHLKICSSRVRLPLASASSNLSSKIAHTVGNLIPRTVN